jgi:hypothetical protein
MLSAAVAWQVGFLVIASDPERYRGMMVATLLEKFIFAAATFVLFLQHRLPLPTLGFGLHDLILGLFFLLSYSNTPRATPGLQARGPRGSDSDQRIQEPAPSRFVASRDAGA